MGWKPQHYAFAGMMLVFGSFNTLSVKWADTMKSENSDGKTVHFTHPFLQACGINTRCSQLLSSTQDRDKQRLLWDSLHTLTSPEKMGQRFKFVSLFPATMREIHEKYPPVGFEARQD